MLIEDGRQMGSVVNHLFWFKSHFFIDVCRFSQACIVFFLLRVRVVQWDGLNPDSYLVFYFGLVGAVLPTLLFIGPHQ